MVSLLISMVQSRERDTIALCWLNHSFINNYNNSRMIQMEELFAYMVTQPTLSGLNYWLHFEMQLLINSKETLINQ